MRKKILLLCALVCLLFAGCSKEQPAEADGTSVYYLSSTETKVEAHSVVLSGTGEEEMLEELLQWLSTNPDKLEYKAPLSYGFSILDKSCSDGKAVLNVSAEYLSLPPLKEVLIRAAIVRTLCQMDFITYVSITVEGEQLFDGMGEPIGLMSADQFIDNDGNAINAYEQVRIKLYFADATGENLISGFRDKYYLSNTSVERLVVEELIAGPSGKVDYLFPTINPSTKIINVMTKDGVCYVNLSEDFLTVVGNVPTKVSVYSIVNSLVELNSVNKVQILVNGEVPASFSNTVFERNLDIVTTIDR